MTTKVRARGRVKLAGGLAGIQALGVENAEELFEPSRLVAGRATVLEQDESFLRARFPLPGTPDARGRLTGRPSALGTGWAVLSLWRAAPVSACLRARLTRPRSASLAEREWNLLCHLRRQGIGTSEPLAVGARGERFLARDSFLVTRELEGALPITSWLAGEPAGPGRALGLEALGHALARLARSGVSLPRLAPEHLWLTPAGEGECAPGLAVPEGLHRKRLPGVALSEVRDGSLGGSSNKGLAIVSSLPDRLGNVLSPEEIALLRTRLSERARLEPGAPALRSSPPAGLRG